MNNNNFLCDRCRKAMCQDCREIADEYAELLQLAKRNLSVYEAKISDLIRQLKSAKRQAADWERMAKLGYPEVIQRWMDSLRS